MKWNSEEGQKILAIAYSLQHNHSNAASTPKWHMRNFVKGTVYGRYSNVKRDWEYSLQPFDEVETAMDSIKGARIVSTGRKPISDELIAEIKQKRLEGHSVRSVAKKLGVSVGVVAKYGK